MCHILRRNLFAFSVLASLLGLAAASTALAGDWPQWRYDAQRSAASPDALPRKLRPAWVRQLPKLRPAWPDQPKMQFDRAYEPVVLGQRLFVGSSHDDSVTAYDTRSGEEVWRFYAAGPVRFAPLAWQDKVYFASDDGYLYCLRASDGQLAWRVRGGPSDRKVLGNERLISTWPARGAPVLKDGKIYFAAGIWPFMGIFLHAVDAETGAVLWTNDGDGSRYMKQPHNSDSFAGVAPQGPLVAIGDKLLIPGGRSVPACYDRTSGEMLYYQLAENGKKGGGSSVAAVDQLLFNGRAVFDLETEKHLDSAGELIAFLDDRLFDYDDGELRAFDLGSSRIQSKETVDRKGKKVKSVQWSIKTLVETEVPELTALAVAGSRVYGGEPGRLVAYDLPLEEDAEIVWEADIEGTPTTLLAADDKLFAVTLEGAIYCFGGGDAPIRKHPLAVPARPAASPAVADRVQSLLQETGAREGYALLVGGSDQAFVLELARQSSLRLVVMEGQPERAAALRLALRRVGWSADRVAVLEADPGQVELPPYFASLIVAFEEPEEAQARDAWLKRLYASLRPFGGALGVPALEQQQQLAEQVAELALPGAAIKRSGDSLLVVREGALPGSANWTHEHADAANTRVSRDTLVKAPLGLLWFGGSSNDAILPRHGHGPQPQVVDGRLFIEGVDVLRAMDIYTGRVLWETKLPGLGKLYNNTGHQPGANSAGTNYIATPDGIYVAYENTCRRLDPVTGKQVAEFRLPPAAGSKRSPRWGFISVAGDYLVGGADPLLESTPGKILGIDDNYSSSKRLAVLDRHSGKVLWTLDAKSGLRHNAICIGGGRLYCIDRLSGPQLARLKRRGEKPTEPPRLLALDLASGEEVWSTTEDVFGTWLSYSDEHDVLVEAGRAARDSLSDEPKGMRAYSAASGAAQWYQKSYAGPAMIHHATILMAGSACDLLTGDPRMREHPLTGEPVEWRWSRNYGCNTPMASEHLLTFRSGAAGYFDYCNDGGTGNFGGFRSSCSNNLVVAGGVLTAPDYTRTCTCSYQNQTSLALVPMPEAEIWTSFGDQDYKQPVKRVGINLGAPGDRKDDSGTLWIDYPSVGGASPEMDITTEPESLQWFRRHSTQIEGSGLAWVAASGAQGLSSLEIDLAEKKTPPRIYTVRLHFAEPDDADPGERVFAIRLQGKPALAALDVRKETGGRHRALIKEFKGVTVTDTLRVELAPDAKSKRPPVLSGVEIQAEGW